jgi:uncharacterized NAD(P)/FAD-binding protein YdhS
MSIDAHCPEDFTHWVSAHETDLKMQYPDQGSHLSLFALNRETQYLEIFSAEKALLATGYWFGRATRPGHFPSPWPAGTLTAQIPQGEQVAVIGTSLSAIDATLTLLSDGRFMRQENGSLRYLPAANSRRVALFSRKGLLPKVRGGIGNRQNRFFSRSGIAELSAQKKGRLELADIFGLLRQAKNGDNPKGYSVADPVVPIHGNPENPLYRILP